MENVQRQDDNAVPTPLSSPALITPQVIEGLKKCTDNPDGVLFQECTFMLNMLEQKDDHSVNIGSSSTEKNWFMNHPLFTSIIAGLIITLIAASWWWTPLMKLLGISK